jgi:hypothetical protein
MMAPNRLGELLPHEVILKSRLVVCELRYVPTEPKWAWPIETDIIDIE